MENAAMTVARRELPNIATASLPESYEAAKTALAVCNDVDECKDWADKAAALASYAKQADDPTLHNYATRIAARAIRRCGELLEQFDGRGRPSKKPGAAPVISQRDAAEAAGISADQQLQAVRVANVPAEEFDAAVESETPPTITRLAEMGTRSQPKPAAPENFPEATHVLGVLHELAEFCIEHHAAAVGAAVLAHEVKPLRADAAIVAEWLNEFLDHLPEEVRSC